MTNILMLGDTHGDRGFVRGAIKWAAENDIHTIYQLGDFGYWPRVNNGQKFLHGVIEALEEHSVQLFWIDGNHEDHAVLQPKAAKVDYAKPVPVKDRWSTGSTFYLPRGYSWEVDGVRFGAFGGAFSIDRRYRGEGNPQYGWFPNELAEPEAIDRLGQVDVLLTHDAPIVPPCMYGMPFKSDPQSQASQKVVYEALVRSKARQVFHGHWHLNERYGVHGANVWGLAMNQDGLAEAGAVFVTDDRSTHSVLKWMHRNG
jgi:predicted phosphodiesterase